MSKIVSRDAENIKLSAIKFEVNQGFFAVLTEVARLHWPMVKTRWLIVFWYISISAPVELLAISTARKEITIATMLLSIQIFIAFIGLAAATPTPEILTKRTISCLAVGSTATARWTNGAGKTCTFTGIVGSNYGANPAGSGEYDALPRYIILHSINMLIVAAIHATGDVERAALELPWAMLTRKTASHMTFAHTSTTLVVVRGKLCFLLPFEHNSS